MANKKSLLLILLFTERNDDVILKIISALDAYFKKLKSLLLILFNLPKRDDVLK